MNVDQDLKTMSVPDLLARFENDIRYGCHSTRAETSRSSAGKELQTRGEEAIRTITARWSAMRRPSEESQVEAGVRRGLAMILAWMSFDVATLPVSSEAIGSEIVEVTQQAGLSR